MARRSWLAAVLLSLFLVPSIAFAAVNVKDEFGKALDKGGITTSGQVPNVEQSLGSIINVVLGFVGMAVLVLVVYAGALWILAAGNEDKITQAKGILKGAVLGLIIVFSAYIIVNFVLQALRSAVTGESPVVKEAIEQKGQ